MSIINSKSSRLHLQCKVKKDNTSSKVEPENMKSASSKSVSSFKEPDRLVPTNLPSTPVRQSGVREEANEDPVSPFFLRCTQDGGDDDADVIWDWDSPRSKTNRRTNLHRKRILTSSPKLPKKQLLSNRENQRTEMPKFNSLKAELEELVTKLNSHSKSRDEDINQNRSCLVIEEDLFVKPKTPQLPVNNKSSDNDLFDDDDSLDLEMIKCSQQVEEVYNLNKWCTSIVNSNLTKPEQSKVFASETIQDDSFDVMLEEIKDEDIELLSQASGCGSLSNNFPLDTKKNQVSSTGIQSSPRSFARTNSMPANFLGNTKPSASSSVTCLFPRTKSEDLCKNTNSNVPIKCSPEEIEKKRLEARAKLELKKKHNEIERKRQEALERLKRNRLQRKLPSTMANLHR